MLHCDANVAGVTDSCTRRKFAGGSEVGRASNDVVALNVGLAAHHAGDC